MAYSFSVGNTPATSATAVWLLAAALVAAGWAVTSDSDGTTYNAAGGQVTGGGTGAHGLGNANAWIRISSPSVGGQIRELTFQLGVAANKSWRIKYSASARFIGGSPAAAVTPSSTDEVFMSGGGTDSSPTFLSNAFPNDASYRWHISCGGSTELYSFLAFGMTSGGTTTTGPNIFLDIMANNSHPTEDIDPAVVGYIQNDFSSTHYGTTFTYTNVTNPAGARAWLGPTSAAGASITSNNVNVLLGAYSDNSGLANPWTTKDDLLPLFWLKRTSGASPAGLKGLSTLFKIGTIARTNMDTCDVIGTKDMVYHSFFWVPWDGSVPTL